MVRLNIFILFIFWKNKNVIFGGSARQKPLKGRSYKWFAPLILDPSLFYWVPSRAASQVPDLMFLVKPCRGFNPRPCAREANTLQLGHRRCSRYLYKCSNYRKLKLFKQDNKKGLLTLSGRVTNGEIIFMYQFRKNFKHFSVVFLRMQTMVFKFSTQFLFQKF